MIGRILVSIQDYTKISLLEHALGYTLGYNIDA